MTTLIQYSTVQYSTVQYSTVQYSTVQYNTIQYNTIQYNTECDVTHIRTLIKTRELITCAKAVMEKWIITGKYVRITSQTTKVLSWMEDQSSLNGNQ